VLKDPPPLAFVTGFAESGVALELGFWIADPDQGTLGVKSEIALEILRRFAAEGLEIPFPQRDVRILSVPGGDKLPPAPAGGLPGAEQSTARRVEFT
jgi:small-conductance mechanosensitive channel